MTAQADFIVGDWLVRPELNRIERAGEQTHIKPKSMAVLIELARAERAVLSRNELMEAVWPGMAVTDDVLTQCVVELRKAFGDEAKSPRYIETIPRRGLRLVADVQLDVDRADEKASTHELAAAKSQRPVASIVVIGLVFVLGLAIYFLAYRPAERDPVIRVEDVPRIAVLPFADLSPDKEQEYFADGLSDELLHRLAEMEGLQVTGRTSSFYFKERNESPEEIGRQLDVGHVLDGSVRKSAEQLRITAQLVDTSNGYEVWSASFDRQPEDIFAVQDEIAGAVAKAMRVKLGVGNMAASRGGTTSLEAYEHYLQGNALYRDFDQATLPDAIEHFRTAVALDPSFALGWDRLADIYTTTAYGLPDEQFKERWRQSDEALERAISLAPDSMDIADTNVFIRLHRQQWVEAERLLLGYSESHRHSDQAWHSNWAQLLFSVGRGPEAIENMEQARRLDPLSGVVAFYLGHVYTVARRFDDALAELERGASLSHYQLNRREALTAAMAMGDRPLVDKWLSLFLENTPPGSPDIVFGTMAELIDDPPAALAWLTRALDEELAPGRPVAIAFWAAYFGDHELAVRSAVRAPNTGYWWHPLLADMRRLPEFKKAVREAGIYDYWRTAGWGEFCRPVGENDFECS
ncbi:MAG: winged helix-turn-helix domain-containing protein [Gammaproteobacteria bacterium]|nr:winged helix-turn-helix domain-containing protein [Gammaproteobacteria bacterium]